MFFSNVVNYVKYGIPRYTNLFSKEIPILSIDIKQGIISSSLPHNLKVGNFCIIKNVNYSWKINNLQYNKDTGVVKGQLSFENLLVLQEIKTYINLTGSFQGKGKLLSFDKDNNVEILIEKGLTIDELYVSKYINNGINSYFRVNEIINEYSIKINYNEELNDTLFNEGQLVLESYVYAGSNVDNFIEKTYKKEYKARNVIYIEYTNNQSSRSNSSQTDFNQSMQKSTAQWITNSHNVNIYYIANTTFETQEQDFIDNAISIVMDSLLKILQNNEYIDMNSRFTLTYNAGSPVVLAAGQTNINAFVYSFYQQNTVASHTLNDLNTVEKIKKVIIDSNYDK